LLKTLIRLTVRTESGTVILHDPVLIFAGGVILGWFIQGLRPEFFLKWVFGAILVLAVVRLISH